MFTGIVEEVGRVSRVGSEGLTIEAEKVLEGTKVGDSINVNGVCLTVTGTEGRGFSVEVMPETRRRTNLGRLRPGDPVNLERALPVGGRLGGHLVQGHVDTTGRVLALAREEEALLVTFSASREEMSYIVEKGFIAVDGVSLTVVDRGPSWFRVSLVRYTIENTNLGRKRPGDLVNLEVDIMAKYAQRLGKPRELTREALARHGFLD